MLRWINLTTCLAVFSFSVLFAVPGCATGKKSEPPKAKDQHADEHGDTGPHGGPLAEWGDYHAEVTIDHPRKQVVVYVLDDKAKKAPDVDPAKFSKVKLLIAGPKPEIVIDLTHDAKKSGKEGIVFTGSHDFFAEDRLFEGTLSTVFEGKAERLQDDFRYEPKKDAADKKKTVSTADLYRTPGGIYTAADIKANGELSPKEKFKGVGHKGGEAKAGDKICPISNEKANPEVSWIVQGQRYEFCCPPCVERFLKLAHNEPAKVKDASAYVKAP